MRPMSQPSNNFKSTEAPLFYKSSISNERDLKQSLYSPNIESSHLWSPTNLQRKPFTKSQGGGFNSRIPYRQKRQSIPHHRINSFTNTN